jgi:hypothetical protein
MCGLLAGACAGIDAAPMPAAPSAEAATLSASRLLGQGAMRFLGMEIYQARLWIAEDFDPRDYAHGALALELRYARALYGRAIAERALQEMRRAGPLADAQAEAWLALMLRAFPDVEAGQRLTGVLRGGQVRFFHEGRPTASTDDPDFARRFFGIWLAEWSSEPALRKHLLGGAP